MGWSIAAKNSRGRLMAFDELYDDYEKRLPRHCPWAGLTVWNAARMQGFECP